ncbi:MAG: CAP domain-containing protein [Anaerolineales bacterium]|nr:MAG: CAP domain-containing protein [Anaerolineales bacterium]
MWMDFWYACQGDNMLRKSMLTLAFLILLSLAPYTFGSVNAQSGFDPNAQTQMLLYDEARTVYLGNLARRDNGIPPLRWNRQLTHAARWFSWDSTENQPPGFCGHQDSQGQWPVDRAFIFGYLGAAGAENAFCGYVTPEYAVQGWMNSTGHRANLLDPNSREIGLGYYLNGDGRGYVTQDFGIDPVYAPIVIDNEAISTTIPDVNLYIFDRSNGGGFTGLGPATQMMVSNNAQFIGAVWEPYTANKNWTLVSGNGWREVFVKTRDKFNRTLTVSDTIYLGDNIPLNELGAAQMSTTHSKVILNELNGGALPQVQFSLGWLADDTYETFNNWWGNGERINDVAAWGGTAYRLYPGNGESFAWVYDTTFIKDMPLVAYFRLKVNDNSSSSEVARISVEGGGMEYGPLSLRGIDFVSSNQYQEFPLDFTFNSNPDNVFLIFKFWRSGGADLYIDAVSIFTLPQPVTSPQIWSVPGNNYRGQGIWVRYTNGSQFSDLSEANFVQIPIQIFGDVPDTYWAWQYIERLYTAGITGGCSTSPLNYCPDDTVTRAQMAVFLLKGVHGSSYSPPPVGSGTGFADVPTTYWAAPWIKQLAAEGITGGCGGGNFCPDTPVTRAQMAVFLLKSKHGVSYVPPAASGVFADVPVGYWADKWIEQLAAEGITGGCGGGNYCPDTPVTRAQMAVFLVKTFNLP